MAKAAGVSHTMVGRIWRTFRLQPHRTESFKLSPDPQLVEKIRDVVGLYVAPPANAVVFAGREIPDPSAATRAAHPADGHRPARAPHPQRCAPWDAGSLRRAQCRDRCLATRRSCDQHAIT
jgi:hypothetical protein